MNNNIHNCSESHFMRILPFYLSKTSVISYTHRTVKVFTATRQNKTLVKLGRHCDRYNNIVKQNVHTGFLHMPFRSIPTGLPHTATEI